MLGFLQFPEKQAVCVAFFVYWDFKTKVNMPLHNIACPILQMNYLSPLNKHPSLRVYFHTVLEAGKRK